jgi:hypothetical protein
VSTLSTETLLGSGKGAGFGIGKFPVITVSGTPHFCCTVQGLVCYTSSESGELGRGVMYMF